VVSLTTSEGHPFILKRIGEDTWSWWARLVPQYIEIALWASRITTDLPPPLRCPTLDVAFHEGDRAWWILMDDVSKYQTPNRQFDRKNLYDLLDGLGRMHAQYWNSNHLNGIPLCPLETHVSIFAAPIAAIGGRAVTEDWVRFMTEKPMLKTCVPDFLNLLGARDADFYLDLCDKRTSWLSKLAQCDQTLLHGDVNRSHFAPSGDAIFLFDWNLAVRGPAAADLCWMWFLEFWCNPPDDGVTLDERETYREHYFRSLCRALPFELERAEFDRSWHLSWLKVFVQLGWHLAKSLKDPAAKRGYSEEARAFCKKAIDHAAWIVESYVN
jgi:hypothetical protein